MPSGSNKEARRARAQQRVEEQMERAQERLERARQQVERGADRAQERLERAQEAVDGIQQSLIWLREEPSARRPSHTRPEIARAAIEIADEEGFDAVSMRRVAQRLGAGTMTLYHYVRNKDELIMLMVDEMMGEILIPDDQLAEGWRQALTQIATRSRDAFIAHRWVLDGIEGGEIGPNAMRHFEQSLQAVASLDLDQTLVFEVIGQVDDYVFGYALRELQERQENERGWSPDVVAFLQRELDTGEYPLIRQYLGEDASAGIERVLELFSGKGRFERGLKRLLDGIEADLGL
ncbi:MAG TPA: TetR/AcrR family transcriptional regulator C-terminal domain-containing protein [Solirubrobacterales bacterium]|nr:TetR/AcrR family transcriptional regulator C-terminal domain-containing protein [Solirubrobacterales bacterium]